MMRHVGLAGVGLAAVAIVGCGTPERDARAPSRAERTVAREERAPAPDPDPEGLARSRSGFLFDPLSVRPGDTIGTLVLRRIAAQRVTPDSIASGTAEFTGSIAVQGTTIRHHEHPDVQATCFEADSASAQRLPRWQGDRRRAWFCLENVALAGRLLAQPGEVRAADIVIDRYTIHRGLSDEVNTARLVRVVRR